MSSCKFNNREVFLSRMYGKDDSSQCSIEVSVPKHLLDSLSLWIKFYMPGSKNIKANIDIASMIVSALNMVYEYADSIISEHLSTCNCFRVPIEIRYDPKIEKSVSKALEILDQIVNADYD